MGCFYSRQIIKIICGTTCSHQVLPSINTSRILVFKPDALYLKNIRISRSFIDSSMLLYLIFPSPVKSFGSVKHFNKHR